MNAVMRVGAGSMKSGRTAFGQRRVDERTPKTSFDMTNLTPRMTGLPMTVWVSPRGNARHDVRIKVNMTHGRSDDHRQYGCCRASARSPRVACRPA